MCVCVFRSVLRTPALEPFILGLSFIACFLATEGF